MTLMENKNQQTVPLPGSLSPEQMAQMAANNAFEGMFPQFVNPEDEGADLHGMVYTILEKTQKNKEVEGDKLKELGKNFDNALVGEIDTVLVSFKDLYPTSDWELETQLKSLNKLTKKVERRIQPLLEEVLEKGGGLDKKTTFLLSVYKKLIWAEGMTKILAGEMISVATYFAGEKRIQNMPNIKITQDDYQKACHDRLEGLPIETRSDFLVNREEVVAMQDDAFTLSLMVAAVQQREPETHVSDSVISPAISPRERERMFLDDKTRQLIEEIFAARNEDGNIIYVNWMDPKTGNTYEVAKEILNYFCMSNVSSDNKRKYYALMTSAVALKALDELNLGKEDPVAIAKKVRERADKILETYYLQKAFGGTTEKYASMAVQAIVAMHLGNMSSGDLGWGWAYEVAAWEELEKIEQEEFEKCKVGFTDLTDAQQKEFLLRKEAEEKAGKKWLEPISYVVLRVKDKGSVYSSDDTPSPFFPEDYVAEYQSRSETTSEVYWGLADEFRRMTRYHRPDWCPPIEKYLANNQYVSQLTNKLLNGTLGNEILKEAVKDEDEVRYGDVDYRIINYINKYKRAWPTWVTLDGKPYSIPLFFPPAWYSLNFWRSLGAELVTETQDGNEIVVGTKAKKAVEAPSLWEKFNEGLRLSKVNFLGYSEHATDWDNVNRVQLGRGLVLLFLSNQFSGDAAQAFGNFVTRPLNINTLKDWDKRMGRLGVRGENVIAGITGMLTFVPFAVKLIAEETGVGQLADLNVVNGRVAINLKYEKAISKLKLNASYLAKTKGLSKTAVTNFNKTYAMLVDFYSRIQLDWSLRATTQTRLDQIRIEKASEKSFEEVYKINKINI